MRKLMSGQNVILITADSVRGDYCGFLNSAVDTTPLLREISNDALIFENAIAPGPRTLSSVPVSHTGEELPVNSEDMSVYQNRVDRIRTHLAANETLARKFKNAGYTTLAFTTNPWTSRTTGFDAGFDVFEEFESQGRGNFERVFSGTKFETPAKFFDQWNDNKVWFSQWPNYYQEVLSAVRDCEKPYFLWVFLLDTHNPYFPHPRDRVESSTASMYVNMLRGNSAFNQTQGMTAHRDVLDQDVVTRIKCAYRDCIRSVDRFVNSIFNDLSESDPLVIFHSDHGEAFGEHGSYGHQPALYEENIRVPLMVINGEESGRISKPISVGAIPALLESALSEDEKMSSHATETVYSRTEDNSTVALRDSRWKFIQTENSVELYDLNQDPLERVDISSDLPEITKSLRKKLDKHLEGVPRSEIETGETVEDDDSIKDRLESLGYIG